MTPLAGRLPAVCEPEVSQLLRRVVGHGLDGANRPSAALLDEPLSQRGWEDFMAEAQQERVLGLVWGALSDGVLAATDEQVAQTHERHVAQLCGDLLRERELTRIVRVFSEAGLDHRALKGAVVARLDYPDPSMRSFVDVDLLVRSDEWDDAIALLERHGWERQFGEPRPGFDRRFVKAIVLRRRQATTELDLHRTFALGPFGLSVVLHDLWQRCQPVRVAGTELKALVPEGRLLHACFHAALGDFPPRLVPLRDVAQMALSEGIDLDATMAMARSWRAEAVVRRAAELTCEMLGLTPATERLGTLVDLNVTRRQAKALRHYESPGRSYVRLCVEATRAIPRLSDKARYLSALAFPGAGFVSERYSSRTDRWQNAGRQLMSHASKPKAGRRRSR